MFDAAGGATEMDLLGSASAGMSAQRSLLDIAARNVAAAQASTPDHPYARLVARFEAAPDAAALAGDGPLAAGDSDLDAGEISASFGSAAAPLTVRTEPGTGDALTEMIAVLDAQRAYEQNASVFDIAKRLAERTIDIGRS